MSQIERIVMPYFVKCSKDFLDYGRHGEIPNNPVNLSLCTNIRKGKFAYYPDNNGNPSIVFDGCDTEWKYRSEKDRDADFERIAGNKA